MMRVRVLYHQSCFAVRRWTSRRGPLGLDEAKSQVGYNSADDNVHNQAATAVADGVPLVAEGGHDGLARRHLVRGGRVEPTALCVRGGKSDPSLKTESEFEPRTHDDLTHPTVELAIERSTTARRRRRDGSLERRRSCGASPRESW